MASVTFTAVELTALAKQLAPQVAAILAGSASTPPPPSGVPWTPPAGAFGIYAYGGARGFTLDNSYGGLLVDYADATHPIAPGPHDISLTGNNGGWQPRYQDPGNFSTAGFNFLVIVAILQPGQDFQIGMDQSNGAGGDAVIVGANQINVVAGGYGPAGDGKTYQVYKIPLGKGGFNMAPGQNVLKFSCQNSGQATPATMALIGGAYFSPS